MDKKRKKIHSPFRNFLYKVIRNRYIYFAMAVIVGGAFLVGIVLGKGNGNVIKNDDNINVSSSVDKLYNLEVSFIDVGQGDCVFVRFPDGKTMLVDGGKGNEEVKAAIDKCLAQNGTKSKIDYCVATHPDEDHIGVLPYIYENYDVAYSYRPYVYGNVKDLPEGFDAENSKLKVTTEAYSKYLKAVANENSGYEYFTDNSDFTNRLSVGGNSYEYTVDFILPYASTVSDYDKFTDSNDYSAVIMIRYGKIKILLTGDINYENGKSSTERRIVAKYENNLDYLTCDVLKVAHHGSETSSCIEFLNAVSPEYAVISCGVGNDYGHPSQDVISRLISINSVICRTDLQGMIKFSVNEKGEIIRTVECGDNDDYLFYSGENLFTYADIEKIKSNKLKSR